MDIRFKQLIVGNGIEKIVANDRNGSENFGWDVDMDGTSLAISAKIEAEDSSGTSNVTATGATYLYDLNAGVLTFEDKITAPLSDRDKDDNFGESVSLFGNLLAVSADAEELDENGANSVGGAGAVYLFERQSSGNWLQIEKLVEPIRTSSQAFW